MALPALALPLAGKLAGLVGGGAAALGGGSAMSGLTGLAKTSSLGALLKAANDPKLAKAKATAQDFETMFLEDTLRHVFASTGDEGPLGAGGAGGDVYKSMLVKEYAKSIVKGGGVGITNQVYGELLKLQEGGAHGGGK
jgi:Rod binding domain-containing protein